MDGRKSRHIGEVLEWYRGEDAGDLKRSELNALVETLACLNDLVAKTWKSDQKVVMDDEISQKNVMDEELVQNGVMDGKFVKIVLMDAKLDPKVVMDLSIFKIGGWNSLQTAWSMHVCTMSTSQVHYHQNSTTTKGWRSAPNALLPGRRRDPSGSRQGHPRYIGARTTGRLWVAHTNAQSAKCTCHDAYSRQSKTQVFRQTW